MKMREGFAKRAAACAAALAMMTLAGWIDRVGAQHEPAHRSRDDGHGVRHDGHEHHRAAATKPVASRGVSLRVPDTTLTDQDGRALRLATDAMGDRLVVINFVYTNCTTVCPASSALMAQVRQQVGDRANQEVVMLSLTVDPVRDTPHRLKEFAARFGAVGGWTWLTGTKPQVDEALRAFDAYTSNFVDHPPLLFVGDPVTGQWKRFYGFPNPPQVVRALDEFLAVRAARAKSGDAKVQVRPS